MSERQPGLNQERDIKTPELEKHHKESIDKAVEKGHHARHEHAEKLLSIQHEAKEKALSAKEVLEKHQDQEKPHHEQPTFINRELKGMAYKRTLTRTQKSLPAPARAFSKVIHNPAVEAVSEIAAKTVARPSGILAGGIIAVIGSSIFLWAAKHYGYEYNFLLFALLFGGGFMLGLLLELIYRLVRKPR